MVPRGEHGLILVEREWGERGREGERGKGEREGGREGGRERERTIKKDNN